jgi:hypothetical protein
MASVIRSSSPKRVFLPVASLPQREQTVAKYETALQGYMPSRIESIRAEARCALDVREPRRWPAARLSIGDATRETRSMHPTARSSTSCASSKPASAAFHGRQRYNNLIVTRRPSSARIQVAAHEEGGLGRRVNYYVGIDCVIGCTEPVGCRWQRHRHLQGKVARQPGGFGRHSVISPLDRRKEGALVGIL